MQRTLSYHAFRLASGLCWSQPDSNICASGAWIHLWSRVVVLKSFSNGAHSYFFNRFVHQRSWTFIVFCDLPEGFAFLFHRCHVLLFSGCEPFRSACAKWIAVFSTSRGFNQSFFQNQIVLIQRIFHKIIQLFHKWMRPHTDKVFWLVSVFHTGWTARRLISADILAPSYEMPFVRIA